MGANAPFWTDAFYRQVTASEEAAIDYLRQRNLLRNLQNPPSKVNGIFEKDNLQKSIPLFSPTFGRMH